MSTIFTGRRKTSVARARLSRGAGTVTIAGREFEDYFRTEKQRSHVLEPYVVL